jgi:hypothetical protein
LTAHFVDGEIGSFHVWGDEAIIYSSGDLCAAASLWK